MIKRLFWILFLLLPPVCASALGFGELVVSSYLDQPLRARVELVAGEGLQAEDIRASLADAETFNKAGVDRPFSLSKLRFKTVVTESGRAYIDITSRETIREPYLDFLVEVAWGGATLVKEFTILLDPPVYEPVAAAVPPAKAPPPAVVKTPAVPAPAASYGPVRNSETLWVIAQKTRPHTGYSIEQMMMALQRANPDAFHRGNVNLLKQGVELTIPGPEFIGQLSRREARRSFVGQTREWRASRGRATAGTRAAAPAPRADSPPAGAPLEAQPEQRVLTEVVDADAAAPTDNLRVIEPEKDWAAGVDTAAGKSYPSGDEEKLREAIADSASDLVAVREINQDLEELRSALEIKIAALRKSLKEKDRTIAALEERLERADDRIEAAEKGIETAAAKAPGSIVGQQQATSPQPAASKPAGDNRWMRSYWLPLLVVVGLLILLLVLALLRKWREGKGVPEPDAFDTFLGLDQQPGSAEQPSMPEFSSMAAQVQSVGEQNDEAGFEAGMDVASALTEADVYLAYRRYTQAENLIREAISHHPQNMILCAKLLEIFAFRKDRENFTAFMEEIHQTRVDEAPEIWAKVVEMGRDLTPRHPLIEHAALPEESQLHAGFEPESESKKE